LVYHWNDDFKTYSWHSGLFVSDDEWVFVALVVEPNKATLYLGQDQELSCAANTTDHYIEEFDGITRIGSDPETYVQQYRYFKGWIDDVRIYRFALSEQEIRAVYAGEGPGPIDRPDWIVDVSEPQLVSVEPETDEDDASYYLPLRSELEVNQAEQKLVEKREAMEIAYIVLGDEDPNISDPMMSLAWEYHNQGMFGQAESLFAKALEIRRRSLGEEASRTLDAMNGLAWTYNKQGKSDQAEPLFRKVLEIRRRLLGEEAPKTLEAMWNITWIYRSLGMYDRAESLLTEVVDVRRRLLGEEDPLTLTSMSNLVSLYLKQGRYEQVESMNLRILEIRRRVLGEEHQDTAGSLNNLAWFWATCPDEQYLNGSKAIEYATKACELTNWENTSYVDTLAAAYAEAGDFDEAVKWQKKAIELITEEDPAEWRIEFPERVKLYQSGKPYREVP
jgi:tetratricopeptide (TPR) repeat protein